MGGISGFIRSSFPRLFTNAAPSEANQAGARSVAEGAPVSSTRQAPVRDAYDKNGAALSSGAAEARSLAGSSVFDKLLSDPNSDLTALRNDRSPAAAEALSRFILDESGALPSRGYVLQYSEDAAREHNKARMGAKLRALDCLGGRDDKASMQCLLDVIQRGAGWGELWEHRLPERAAVLLAQRTDAASTAVVRQEMLDGFQGWSKNTSFGQMAAPYFEARSGAPYDSELVGKLIASLPKDQKDFNANHERVVRALEAYADGKGPAAMGHIEALRAVRKSMYPF